MIYILGFLSMKLCEQLLLTIIKIVSNYMILYIENPKDATRKLLELINEHSKIAGYKINPQKSFVFL